MLVITLLIKLTSPGPVFYRGVRTGRYGIPFRIFKFRTMVVNAEQVGGTSTARDDPRVTPIGRRLRRSKLDELPQLFNVLRGEMSFVGPRPEVREYTDMYTEEEQIILSVRPGITDLASIEFVNLGEFLGNDNPDEVFKTQIRPIKNRLRVQYAREHSFWGDLKLIFRTLITIARQ